MPTSGTGVFVLWVLVAMLCCCAVCTAQGRWEPPGGRFPVLGWVNPAPEGYRTMAGAGFTVASAVTPAELPAIRDAGMKAILQLGGSGEQGVQAYVRSRIGDPTVIGFEQGDEPSAGAFPALAERKGWALKAAPNACYLVNLFPNYANEQQLGTPTYEEHVQRFISTYRPTVLSFDHYPLVGTDGCRANYYENLEIIRAAALKADIPFWAFTLVSPHWGYRDPTEAEVRFQIFSDLVYGAQGIWYFCYRQTEPGTFRSAVVDVQGRPTHHYPQARRINAIIAAWGPTLLKLRSTGVFHVGELPQGTRPLPTHAVVRAADFADTGAPRGLIVGCFRHVQGGEYVMLMNKDWHRSRAFELRFEPGVKALAEVSRSNGQMLPPLAVGAGPVRLDIAAGGARLFALKRG